VDNHWASSALIENCRMIAGMATLMMVASTTIEPVANTTVRITSRR
jgi:hypothetical protein